MNYDAIAFWSQIVGFVLFAAFIVWAMAKWITPAVASAAKASNDRIALAERHRDEMIVALDALRHEIDGAKRDAASIIAMAEERAKHEREAIVAEAREAGERAVRNANGEFERARAQARRQLRDRIAGEALALARTQAEQRVDGNVNAQIVQQFVGSLERGGLN